MTDVNLSTKADDALKQIKREMKVVDTWLFVHKMKNNSIFVMWFKIVSTDERNS